MKIAKVLNDYNFVINAGFNQGITEKDEFVIYSEGDEIIDPENGESLGRLELPKTRCHVIRLQENIAIIKSYDIPKKKTMNAFTSMNTLSHLMNIEYEDPDYDVLSKVDKKVAIGDLVKRVLK